MKPYLELTRRGRLHRLRKLAETACTVYGLDGGHLSFLQFTSNITYRVDVPGAGSTRNTTGPYLPGRYLLRIHNWRNTEATQSELTWLNALKGAGLPVPAPVPTPDGQLWTIVTIPAIPQGRLVSLMRWLDGRRLEHGLRPKHLQALGQVVAHLHSFSTCWQPPPGFIRPHWDWDAQLGGSMFACPRDELVATMPCAFREPFQVVSQEARQAMEALGKDSQAYGLVHADLYPENVLYRAGRAYPIDFEDCGYSYWLSDIAVALSPWAWGEDWERMRDAFHQGYTQVRTLPETQWRLLDLFVAAQFATMLLWASDFLRQDPLRAAEHEPWRDDSGNKLLGYFKR